MLKKTHMVSCMLSMSSRASPSAQHNVHRKTSKRRVPEEQPSKKTASANAQKRWKLKIRALQSGPEEASTAIQGQKTNGSVNAMHFEFMHTTAVRCMERWQSRTVRHGRVRACAFHRCALAKWNAVYQARECNSARKLDIFLRKGGSSSAKEAKEKTTPRGAAAAV